MIYFDNAATTQVCPEAVKAAIEMMTEQYGNPSSTHSLGRGAAQALKRARETLASALGAAKASEIIFTSCGSESDNWALLSGAEKMRHKGRHIISSQTEHDAILKTLDKLDAEGWEVTRLAPEKDGSISVDRVRKALRRDTVLVSLMQVNNETGAIQPVKEIAAALLERYKGKRRPRFHVDCVQALGKVPIDFLGEEGVDSAAFSAHKISGPRGIGLLYLKKEEEFFLRGGGQEGGARSGTENLFGAIALAECLEKYAFVPSKENPRLKAQNEWTADFIKGLLCIKGASIIPESRSGSLQENFSPWIVQASFKNIPGQVMLRALDAKGIFISTGSACSSKKASRPILEAMQVPADVRENSVRFSFGHKTTREGMEELLKAVREVCAAFN